MYFFDSLVAFRGQSGQILAEAHNAVVCASVRGCLNLVIGSYSSRLLFPLPKSPAKIVYGIALLLSQSVDLCTAQHICEGQIFIFDVLTLGNAERKHHQI
ncbi:hypothetical protein B5M45_00695 [Mycobacterium simiae]|uniref:Uncharacterized protein n=1 Tax=Mycobacterium simiae TaxID=1784 RepID=A0A1X0YH88_MYCSI|nr:hypothetical protein B5M45_00695 [Mycobacterium simiae]